MIVYPFRMHPAPPLFARNRAYSKRLTIQNTDLPLSSNLFFGYMMFRAARYIIAALFDVYSIEFFIIGHIYDAYCLNI